MINQLAAAFDRQDYRTAAQLLQTLEQDPQQQANPDPWVLFYRGRLQEVAGQLDSAERTFQRVLKLTTHLRLTNLSRQSIQRVQTIEREQRQRALAQATADPASGEPGCLVLQPVDPELKAQVAPRLGRLLKLDPYTVRLQLPTRQWRFYRTGAIGELRFYVQAMAELGVPAFCVPLSRINTLPVFRVTQCQTEGQTAQFTCQSHTDEPGTLTVGWDEVKLWVEGLLPLFESVVDRGYWGLSTVRKDKTQDYAQVVDLHLPDRGCIVRLCDRTYVFPGYVFPDAPPTATDPPRPDQPSPSLGRSPTAPLQAKAGNTLPGTHHQKWVQILTTLRQQLPHLEPWTAFNAFAKTALDHTIFLEQIPPHLHLLRREDCPWDNAFHLYSTLAHIQSFDPTP
ncbi:hypothetical protein [Prochlorothrix hollandica]|uniref:Cyclic nucleotide-binding protein n=1 Tax=Prochlorothrix hollandica PCC 9006 = CALU 1027 TaxID=317619 RepID=A0A0M2PZZ3_PROHO|nr:hypothetical protein [Prochlorothrix hollandica]KKJ00638.1 hypothetical protein PROH_04850 [Prochlorothrix hollandica PCC 9006 = CALU 1027]